MPAKKTSAITARTLKARVSDAPLLKKLDALKAQYGLNESSLLREALRDYVDRERMRQKQGSECTFLEFWCFAWASDDTWPSTPSQLILDGVPETV